MQRDLQQCNVTLTPLLVHPQPQLWTFTCSTVALLQYPTDHLAFQQSDTSSPKLDHSTYQMGYKCWAIMTLSPTYVFNIKCKHANGQEVWEKNPLGCIFTSGYLIFQGVVAVSSPHLQHCRSYLCVPAIVAQYFLPSHGLVSLQNVLSTRGPVSFVLS